MKAVCWYGKNDVRVERVPDARVINPRDAVVKVTLSAICGSDLHLYNGYTRSPPVRDAFVSSDTAGRSGDEASRRRRS